MNPYRYGCRLMAALAAFVLLAPAAHAQSVQDFYKGKQIRMIVGFPAGNEYDIGARLLARYWEKHIPGNPNIVVQNMPNGASIQAANYVYEQAPKDGTVIGAITRNIVNSALLATPGLTADPKKFIWLGGTSFPGRVCVAGKNSPAQNAADVFAKEVIIGSVAPGNSTHILPTVFNNVLGTKFKIIQGYKGTADIVLAIERDEVQAVCASWGQFRPNVEAFQNGRLKLLFSAEEGVNPEIPNAQSIYTFAKTEQQKQFMRFVFASTEYGRPYVLPPGVPAERVAVLRKALADAVEDPELIAEAEKGKIDMAFRPPEELERVTKALFDTPADLIENVKKLLPDIN
jgi:tripartite-type tricarboxylate transporter receptor subunit TctC